MTSGVGSAGVSDVFVPLTLRNAGDVTGVLPVANGGSGAVTLTGILKGNGTSAITAAATLAVADGGTGQSTLTNGQLLIGNTTGNTLAKATLTAGNSALVTNGTGTITLNAVNVGGGRLLAAATAVNLNGTGDRVTLTILTGVTKWIPRRVIVTNASASFALSVFTGTLRTAAAGAGSAICAAIATAGLTSAPVLIDQTITLNAQTFTETSLFLNGSVASGLVGTVDVYIFGDDLTSGA